MRYPDSGGLDARRRARREEIRVQDAELFEHNVPAVEVAVRLRASAKPAYAKEAVACSGQSRAEVDQAARQ